MRITNTVWRHELCAHQKRDEDALIKEIKAQWSGRWALESNRTAFKSWLSHLLALYCDCISFFKINHFNWRLITLQYCSGFCHTLTWISHGCACVPHPEPPAHLPPHSIPQGHPSAPALSTLSHASNLDWRFVSHMIIYMFQCYSLRSSHPRLLTQSPKDCSLHLCLFCCLAYRVIITIFLNPTYMCYSLIQSLQCCWSQDILTIIPVLDNIFEKCFSLINNFHVHSYIYK